MATAIPEPVIVGYQCTVFGCVVVKLCACGCGQPVPIAQQTDARYGHIKGQPIRFVRGHNSVGHGPLGKRKYRS